MLDNSRIHDDYGATIIRDQQKVVPLILLLYFIIFFLCYVNNIIYNVCLPKGLLNVVKKLIIYVQHRNYSRYIYVYAN